MDLQGSVALVTGANRGLGRAFANALLEAGAAKVYAGVRHPAPIADPRLTPVQLDVTSTEQVTAAAASCGDVDLLINNAGIMSRALPLAVSLEDARAQLEVNYLGQLAVAQAFAPVLASNGGGALVNMLSVLSWVAMPQVSGYAASKAAAWSLTNALRTQLRANGTLVVGVHCAYVDTDMAKGVELPKLAPEDVAAQTLDALRADAEEVLADELSRNVKAGLADDLRLIYPGIQQQYDAAVAAATGRA